MIYVEPLLDDYTLENTQYYEYPTPQTMKKTDLHITVIATSLGRDSISPAMGGSYVIDEMTKRPIQGVLLIDTKHIPLNIEGEDTIPKYVFMSYIHEFIHILGLEYEQIKNFHPIGSYNPYQIDDSLCYFTKYGVDFLVLTTPFAHIFAKNHYGVDEFIGDNGTRCKSGIQLETGGDSDIIRLNHLEGRLFLDDIMTGYNLGPFENEGDTPIKSETFQRITDATLAVLLDTGNYKINYKMASPLVWGNPESIDGKPIKDFAIGPPQAVFPFHYTIGLFNSDPHTLFNYKGLGFPVTEDIDEAHRNDTQKMDERFCNHQNFYNPANYDYYGGNDIFDYMMLVRPITMCPKDQASLPGGPDCYTFTCDGYDSVSFPISIPNKGTTHFKCTSKDDQSLAYIDKDGGQVEIKCVNPEIFCRTVKLADMKFKKNPFIDGVIHLNDEDQGPGPDIYPNITNNSTVDDSNNKKQNYFQKHLKYFIIGFVILGILILVTIFVLILVNRRDNISSSQAGLEDLQQD